MEYEVKITVRDVCDTVIMAKWIRDNSYQPYTAQEALTIAKALKAGETWSPCHRSMKRGYEQNPYFDVKVDKILDEDEKTFYASREKQERLWELCQKGAEGDTAAAIAWCKAEVNGEVFHGPYAGGCA